MDRRAAGPEMPRSPADHVEGGLGRAGSATEERVWCGCVLARFTCQSRCGK